MIDRETRIITAALPFANAVPHLGNIVGSHLPADIFARYCRIKGHRTIFVGGLDEYGTAIEFAAQKLGVTPQSLCDQLYKEHKKIYDWFNISYDNFFRTSDPLHHQLVQEFAIRLYEKNILVEKSIELPFCLTCQKFLADRYIKGICPKCGNDNAHGGQCENCATVLTPRELENPHCAICGSYNIEFRKKKHLFLELKQVLPLLEKWLDNNSNIKPQVKNLAKGWLNLGINARCITRDLKWGVPVPIKDYKDKVFYVWFDNVIGYISATVNLLGEEGKKLWMNPDTKTYYFLGKDNIPFHTIFWPGQIIADGRFVLPHNVIGLQYLNFEGQKFSKSKQIGIFGDQVMQSNIPVDYWRFYLTRIIPEKKDTEFTIADFQEKINTELNDNIGNFINRTIHLIWSKKEGKLPQLENPDKEIESQINLITKKIDIHFEKCEFKYALQEILKLADFGNKYIADNKPWQTGDVTVLSYCYEICRILAIYLSPITPHSSQSIFELLKTNDTNIALSKKPKSVKQPRIIFRKLEESDLLRIRKLIRKN